MSVFQFRKTPLHRQGIPSRILAISPAIRDSTKVQNAVSTTSAESLAFFSSCASACARVSRWRSYSIVPGWRSASLACRSSSTSRRSFSFSISASLSAYHFITAADHKADSLPYYHRLAERAFPVPASSEWYGYRTENVSQLLFVDFHCSFHG